MCYNENDGKYSHIWENVDGYQTMASEICAMNEEQERYELQ